MQKLHVYGHPRLPIIGTILKAGAFRSVDSMNFQRSRTPGSAAGCRFASRCTPIGRCGEHAVQSSQHHVGRADVVMGGHV